MTKLSVMSAERPAIGTTADADLLIRTLLLAAVFLLLWVSFRPFGSLADPPQVTDAGNLVNQIGYSLLFFVLAAWCLVHQPSRLLLLARPTLVATLFWFVLSTATSWEPSLSVRRLAFTLVTIGIAGMAMLLPKNIRHFGDVMTAVVLIVLLLCYLGVLFLPALSIHQSTDFLEPELAGNWRGIFGHKNEAGATMGLFVFIGLFVARTRSVVLGVTIAVPALIFLLFSQSKTAIAMLPLVLIISAIMSRVRSAALWVDAVPHDPRHRAVMDRERAGPNASPSAGVIDNQITFDDASAWMHTGRCFAPQIQTSMRFIDRE